MDGGYLNEVRKHFVQTSWNSHGGTDL